MISDFRDAFYTMPLHPQEEPFAVVKGQHCYYLLKTVVFGLACGPLLWARLAAWAMRLGQAVACSREAGVQCFVDDPLVLACGCSARQRTRAFLRYLLTWTCLGFSAAWNKVSRGSQVDWIGVNLKLPQDHAGVFEVSLSPAKTLKLMQLLQEILQAKDMFAIAQLAEDRGHSQAEQTEQVLDMLDADLSASSGGRASSSSSSSNSGMTDGQGAQGEGLVSDDTLLETFRNPKRTLESGQAQEEESSPK